MTGYSTYARTNIQTADPRAVVVLLYEGAIQFLNQACDALAAEDRLEMSRFVNKTLNIIQFMDNALDYNQGGEIATNLNRLYCYMRDQLLQANIHCDARKIAEVILLFKPLLEAWREIAKDPTAAAALEKRSALLSRNLGAPPAVVRHDAPPPARNEPGETVALSPASAFSPGGGGFVPPAGALSAYGLRR